MVTQCQYYDLIANTGRFRSPLHKYLTGTGMANSYVQYLFTPGFLVMFSLFFLCLELVNALMQNETIGHK